MDHSAYSDKYMVDILSNTKTIAIVGASPKTIRPSFFVMKYLIARGYNVIPVNPGHAGKEICGQKTVASLADIKQPIDMVDIFRNSEAALSVVEEALTLAPLPKYIWMQLSVFNQEAAELAEAAGVKVVMNRCPKIEYARLTGEIGRMGIASNTISSKMGRLSGGYQMLGFPKK